MLGFASRGTLTDPAKEGHHGPAAPHYPLRPRLRVARSPPRWWRCRWCGRRLTASTGGLELRNLELVRSYYAVAGDALHTGDVAAVERFLANDFVEHQERAGMPAGRAGVPAFLAAVHASLDDVEMTVADAIADGDRVTARVTFAGRQRPAFVGIPMEPATVTWETIDVWRMAGGKLAEHWGDGDAPSLLATAHRTRAWTPTRCIRPWPRWRR